MTLDIKLITQQDLREKYDKLCIIIIFACNLTGFYKLDLWFIGKALNPQGFGCLSINIKIFYIVWKYN